MRCGLGFALALAACTPVAGDADTATEGTETGTCPVGAVGCACTPGGSCDPGLDCVGGVCNDPGCPVGAPGCACTPGGSCDPGLQCMGGYCVDPSCGVGAPGCMCTPGGSCDPGLECQAGFCIDPGGTSSATSGPSSMSDTQGPTSASSDASASTSGVSASATSTDDGASVTSGDDTSSTTGEPVDLDAWTKRRPVYIDNATDEDLIDFEVFVDLGWDADFAFDLRDLRFTNAAGTQLLPHWVEGYAAPTSASVWVRVPSVPARDVATIYVWYGNADAIDAADPYATFHWFDGFEGAELDPATWLATGVHQVGNGILHVQTGSVYSTVPLVSMPGYAVEARMLWETQGSGFTGVRLYASQVGGGPTVTLHRTGGGAVGGATNDMGVQVIVPQNLDLNPMMSVWYYFGTGMTDEIIRFMQNHTFEDSFLVSLPGDYYVDLAHYAAANAGNQNCDDTQYDHVLVRRFVQFEPSTFAGAEEDV